MAMGLLLTGAVPFTQHHHRQEAADSIAARRARRRTGGMRRMEEMLMIRVAEEAVQFVLGPQHRQPGGGPTVMNPEAKAAVRAPPNTPNNAQASFDFPDLRPPPPAVSRIVGDDTDNEADCSSGGGQTSGEDEAAEPAVKANRKRRRVCSFSGSRPWTRRVPHKKASPVKQRQAEEEERRQAGARQPEVGLCADLPDCGKLDMDKLELLSRVQREAAGAGGEERWARLGRELRAIADCLEKEEEEEDGARNGGGGGRAASKELGDRVGVVVEELMPNNVLSAVISYVIWKILRKLY